MKRVQRLLASLAAALFLQFALSAGNASAIERNLYLLERFNSGLSAWRIETNGNGAAASIAFVGPGRKLMLKKTGLDAAVSVEREFAEPGNKWIIEYDLSERGAGAVMELLSDNNEPVVTVDAGSISDTVSFGTDRRSPVLAGFKSGGFKQVILVINAVHRRVRCYVSEDDPVYGSLKQADASWVGASSEYSGTKISKVRFRTGNGDAGEAYVDEVKIYRPGLFIIGDSIADGKPLWSVHPGYEKGRLSGWSKEDSAPNYALSRLLDGSSGVWVADRAFGGSSTSGVEDKILPVVIDHYASSVMIAVGHNDILRSISLSRMQSNMESILDKAEYYGITGKNIILANIPPGADLTGEKDDKRRFWNKWLRSKAEEIGAVYIDLDSALRDELDDERLSPAYGYADGVHLTPEGSRALAEAVLEAVKNNSAPALSAQQDVE